MAGKTPSELALWGPDGTEPDWVGSVRGLFTAKAGAAPMESWDQVTVVSGVGIEGDRYAAGDGRFSGRAKAGEALTLVEQEAIEAVRRDYGLDVSAEITRRNVLTLGVPLNHLIGKKFQIGGALVCGVKLAEPCSHLAKLANIPELRKAFAHRGGLRVDILTGGVIRLGDRITPTFGI